MNSTVSDMAGIGVMLIEITRLALMLAELQAAGVIPSIEQKQAVRDAVKRANDLWEQA